MPREDEEPAEGKASPMAGAELLIAMRKLAVLELPDQQIEVTTQEAVDHPSGVEVMAEGEGLVTNVISAINRVTDHLNV